LNFSPGGGAADDDGRRLPSLPLANQMIIKRVQRLADFEHDVIRHVHDVADAADADFFQASSAANPGLARPSRL
jgi:predicted alpha/beta-fold hydrolase